MARLRRSDCSGPGITRKRRGKGFQYLDDEDRPITEPSVVERINELAIPPAWQEVWICPYPMGHIQATGTDAAGRKQYRYHERWRQRRDAEKFDEMLDFARDLPKLRAQVAQDLSDRAMSRARVLAAAVRLLDHGFFRIGSESYAEENETYGLATMKKSHVTVSGPKITFDYEAKGNKKRLQSVADVEVAAIVETLKRRRGGIDELLAYKEGRSWRDVKSTDINEYLKDATGGDYSAKDFRTWGATVLAAWFLSVASGAPSSKTARKRAKAGVVKDVARYLGNTPAVARASYIDPRVFDRYDGGVVIAGASESFFDQEGGWSETQPAVEREVITLIEDEDSPSLQRAA